MFFSDLHAHGVERAVLQQRLLRVAREENPDLILNAGDFSNTHNPEFIQRMEELGKCAPYVSVMGNHDFYQNYHSSPEEFGVGRMEIGDHLVLSATLWTNYFDENPEEMNAYKFLNDKYYIKDWSAERALGCFKNQFSEIRRIVSENPDKKIILLTHHGISRKSISPQFQESSLNGSFVNDLDDWILQNQQIVLCVHGHIHQSMDYKIGETRVLAHSRGYPREENYSNYEARFVEI